MDFNSLPINARMHALRHSITNYDEWVDVLYKDIDEVFATCLDQVEILRSLKEPQISSIIGSYLGMRFYTVGIDADKNGNADLSVQSGSFRWIGEAKIISNDSNTDLNYLFGVLKQLLTRYSKGQGNALDGGMLIYIKPNSRFHGETDVLASWIQHVESNEQSYLEQHPCPNKKTNIVSKHKHPVTKNPYAVRHMPLTLLHLPEDGSGLEAKKYEEERAQYELASIGPAKSGN